jgi:membrane-bound lytic murein transglycosylase D
VEVRLVRFALLPAASLTLALCACAPSLRPITLAAPNDGATTELDEANVGNGGNAVFELPPPERGSPADFAFDRASLPPALRDATAVSWDIDVDSYAEHESVERYVARFTGPARARTAERLRAGTRYEPLIRAKLRAAGMPEDLYYLAFVESGFDPHAYSRAAAVGMWQFMTTTARAVGLRVDWWVDERRDVVRATDGAVRHLRDLRRQFGGSAYLAAAAYNGGSGRISRGLSQHAEAVADEQGEDRFFALAETGYLRAETREYVPQLIAAAMIGKTPGEYGMLVAPLPPLAYDSVTVPGATPLAAVAEAGGVTLAEVLELNGRFLRGMTPPTGDWDVRVPAGRGAGFTERFAALPDSVRQGVRRVTLEESTTLAELAEEHDLDERQLGWYNPTLERTKKGKLVPGQTVLVPSRTVVEAALDVPDPAVERYGTSPGDTRAAAAPKVHEVKAGESLDRIARRYDLTVAKLKALNGLKKDLIRPGQELVVSGEPAASKKASAKKASAKKKTAKKTAKKKAAK